APALVVTLDLLHATPEQCRQIADDLARQIPRLDGVLHNAGLLGDIAPMADLSMTMWQEVMQGNVNATIMLTQALLPLLLKSHA
ncbi:SDR family NAD(P)-dependent oxidoreductase, partial [Acinetobacter baumannii]